MTATTLDVDSLTLESGSHSRRADGLCLMEARRGPGGRLQAVPIEQRLWSRVTVVDGCWEFQGSRSDDGYGTVRHDGKMRKAHRVAFQLSIGEIPAGLVVMHVCDNPPCINPAHLVLGTVADNNRDRHSKGRTVMPTNGPEHLRNRTHCPQGHPYSGDNVRYRANGARRCAQCYRDRARAARSKKESTR